MKAIFVKTGKPATEIAIANNGLAMRDAIDCEIIQFVYPFRDKVAIVCDDCGKIYNKPYSAVLCDEDGEVYDTINGDFLVVGVSDDGECCDLTDEQIEKYKEMYARPQIVVNDNGKYYARPISVRAWEVLFNNG